MKYKIDYREVDITSLTDKELMNLKYDCIECQNGYDLKKIQNEINRRFKNE